MNRLIFIVPFYNVSRFINECAQSLIQQNYTNWHAIFVDDKSTDDSVAKIPFDQRFSLVQNRTRKTALPNIHNAIMNADLDDEDIICLLDGDDKLAKLDVCSYINDLYNYYQPLVTYGQYITSEGWIGHCRPYSPLTFELLRRGDYLASSLRTFKFKVYKEILNQDPLLYCFKDKHGNMYKMTYDVAMLTPLLEIAGFDRVLFNPEPLYYYRLHNNNDHVINGALQASVANEIANKKKFNCVAL